MGLFGNSIHLFEKTAKIKNATWSLNFFRLSISLQLLCSSTFLSFGLLSALTIAHAQSTELRSENVSATNTQLSGLLSSSFQSACHDGMCTLQFNATEQAVVNMLKYTEALFVDHTNNTQMGPDGLKDFMTRVGILSSSPDPHAGHDHSSHGHDDDEYVYLDYNYDYDLTEPDLINSTMCLNTEQDLLAEYGNMESLYISLSEFWLLLPRMLFDLHTKECDESNHDDHGHEESSTRKQNRAEVWGFAILSVAVISALSVIGILLVPLMKHSVQFNRLLSFLVALAVGTLIGDALLHLLPHAMGGTDHTGHDHSAEEGVAEERQKVLKSLVAVLGIYAFFVFESVMTLLRNRKRKNAAAVASSSAKTPGSPAGSADSPESAEIQNLLNAKETHLGNGDVIVDCSHANGTVCINTHETKQVPKLQNGRNGIRTNHVLASRDCGGAPCNNHHVTPVAIESPHHLNGPHHHHHHSCHHANMTAATGIKDMAWMIVMGDGLHNFSDGLAIGAAFSSSVAAGLSTSLAVFCHELPHELGDFAVLLKAGMSIKQAILYNGLCACLAFFGVLIGMAVGEYTSSVKLWILAVTAGGFLYVALVDMIPQMLESTAEEDAVSRFAFQNVGLVIGVVIMLLIALYESSFQAVFGAGHAHF